MSKKMLTFIAVAAALLALGVTAVAAQTRSASPGAAPQPTTSKQCYSEPCYGNANRETIYERIGDGKSDLIRAFGNYDRLHANTYSKDKDKVYGYGGDDFIYVDDHDDLDGAIGGTGYDWCYVDAEIEAADTCDRVVVR